MSNHYLAKAMPNAMSNEIWYLLDMITGQIKIPKNIMIFLKLKIYTILIIRTFKKVNNFITGQHFSFV